MKVAVTECGWTIGTVHVAVVPLGPHAPPHPPNVLPEQTLTWVERAAELRAGFML